MIKSFRVNVRLTPGDVIDVCQGKLSIHVISSTRFTSVLELIPNKEFTKTDLKENPHFRAYFTEDEVGSRKRRKKPVVVESEEVPKKSKQNKPKIENKPVEIPQIKLPQLNLQGFKLP